MSLISAISTAGKHFSNYILCNLISDIEFWEVTVLATIPCQWFSYSLQKWQKNWQYFILKLNKMKLLKVIHFGNSFPEENYHVNIQKYWTVTLILTFKDRSLQMVNSFNQHNIINKHSSTMQKNALYSLSTHNNCNKICLPQCCFKIKV